MKRYVMGFVVLAVVGGQGSADDKTDAEMKKLEGDWEMVALEIGGKKIEPPKGKAGSILFDKDGKILMKDPGKPDKPGTYKIDTTTSPKQIDLIETKNEKGKPGMTMRCIYEIDGESLKLAFSAQESKVKRPGTFQGDKVMIMHLKRKKS